ncbi:dihydrofolate reductase family protein [Qipengyuania spongiae]|uniref:Dihydrofolate reductase family protein n=1 Tax=Qipengyuania spongiae TaxID=2909673 RepID=A0ABY5SYD4_9SPHN|nr:dihydrofolate reductase family protein [Qipengyuania spongiae]UVI39552.1 dihydrofolate reductase family protein [Qipengyuania spongiae]
MARKITGAAFLSLDGVMQGPGGPTEDPTGGFDQGGWVFKFWDDAVGETLGTLFDGDYDLLLGRRTYDIFAAYWPYVEGEEAGMGEAFTRANKYVLSRGEPDLSWANSHRLASLEDLARIKEGNGPRIVIQGSSTIYPALLAAGLIDELITMIYPVILGSGKRLFGDGTPTERLEMTDHHVTEQGTIIAHYRPAGTLPPYPDEAPEPATSDREKARRARIEEGSW